MADVIDLPSVSIHKSIRVMNITFDTTMRSGSLEDHIAKILISHH